MTREQQKRLNAQCGDLEQQVRLNACGRYVNARQAPDGIRVCKDSWRWIFCGTFKGWKTLPAIEGNGFVMLGASSRDLTVEEAGDVMTMIEAFGLERGVQFSDPREAAMRAQYEQEAMA
jgi:hypothetical protein